MHPSQDEESLSGVSPGGRSGTALNPDAEHACVLRLARLCRELLGAMPEPCTARTPVKPDSCTTASAKSSCVRCDHGRASSRNPVGVMSDPCEERERCRPPSAGSAEGTKGSEATLGCNSSAMSEPTSCTRQALGVKALPEDLVSDASQVAASSSQDSWRRETHTEMAVGYCLQRKLLLQRVAADLECQTRLISDCSGRPISQISGEVNRHVAG